MPKVKVIKLNKIQCKHCKQILISTHRHDWKQCVCKTVFVDGGNDYLRRGFKQQDDYIELSEYTLVKDRSRK